MKITATRSAVLLCCALSSMVVAPSALAATTSNTLSDVVVTASRFDRDSDTPSTPIGAVVITGEEIRRSGFSNVAEAIEKLGQVRVFSSLDGSPNRIVDLGGYGETASSNTVVYLDDIRLSETDMGAPRLQSVPIDLIERIELVPGGQAVAYGEGATGGVVRIVTKRDQRAPLSGSVTAAIGSYSARELRGFVSAQAGNFGLFASAGQTESDGYRETATSQGKNGSLGFNWREGHYRASFLASSETQDADLPGALSLSTFRENPRARGPLSAFITSRSDSQTYNLNLAKQTDSRLLSVDLGRRDRGGFFEAMFGPSTLTARQDSALLKYRDILELAGQKVDLNAGVEQRDADYRAFNSIQQLNRALFGTASTALDANWQVAVGSRIESVEKLKTNTNEFLDRTEHGGEFGVTRLFTETTKATYRYSRSFRNANADEEGFAVVGADGFLKTQLTRMHELLLSFRTQGGASQSLRAYRSAGIDEIQYDPTRTIPGGMFPGANANLDPTLRLGIEHRLDWDITPSLKAKTRLNYVSAKFDGGANDGRFVPLVPQRQASVNLGWTPAERQRIEFYVTAASSSRQSSDFDNSLEQVAGYVVGDVRYVYDNGRQSAVFAINNIADRSYVTQVYFAGYYPENGRNFRLTLRQSF